MTVEAPLFDWAERWLEEWLNEAGSNSQLREEREWLANGWRALTLDAIVREHWHLGRDLVKRGLGAHVNDELRLYAGVRHALPLWRAFLYLRSKGEPIPEVMLAKFEQWGRRLVALDRRNATGKVSTGSALASFSRGAGQLSEDDDKAALQLLELSGTRGRHVSFKRLRELEARRHVASEIAILRSLGLPWKAVAERVKVKEQAAKDLLQEFAPKRTKPGPSSSGRTIDVVMQDWVKARP